MAEEAAAEVDDGLDLTTETESTVTLVDKKNTKSEVWKHFALRTDRLTGTATDSDKPVCKLCNATVSAKYGNTSNLFAHLKNQHVDVYDTIKRMSNEKRAGKSSEQSTIIESFAKARKLAITARNTES